MTKIIYFIVSFTLLFGVVENNISTEPKKLLEKNKPISLSSSKENMIELLIIRKEQLEKAISKDNIWSKIYSNYKTYMFLKKESKVIDAKISLLKKRRYLNNVQKNILEKYKEEKKTINSQLQLLSEYENNPFQKLVKPEEINEVPSVSNPFAILSALSFSKRLKGQLEDYTERYNSLNNIVENFREEKYVLKELISDVKDNSKYKKRLKDIQDRLKTYIPILEIFKTTLSVYRKKIDEIEFQLHKEINREISKSASVGAVVIFFLLFFLLGKFLVRKYMENNDRYYTINKVMNITFITFFIMTLLFGYIENVSYLVTVLGFASAGIAIAMKDWFMSVMGWFVIIIGGSIHVGDRVKFVRGNVEYIGDIVDISILRMTLHEDVTLTTYMHNRRSGRMIFIPNNFIFTDMIANYSHAGLKTVWDGIDFVVTFDSDINKASSIAKEVTKQYSKGYTDITRKQLNKLRSSYSIRNTNVEPRILTLIDENGIRISSWYLTNAYATMTLRSTISLEIITRIQAEESVKLAFPTQSIYVDKSAPKPMPPADLNNGIV